MVSSSLKVGEDQHPSLKIARQRANVALLSPLFYFNRLDEIHPYWEGQSALFHYKSNVNLILYKYTWNN